VTGKTSAAKRGQNKTAEHGPRKKVVVCGGGMAGINAVKSLARNPALDIVLVDKKNYHLFQPLLYQVATGGLDPSDIAPPIRSIVYQYPNVRVLQEAARSVDLDRKELITSHGTLTFDYLILACGVQHMYFGHEDWEPYAPGLKNVEQAVEIRNRVLEAFEIAEREVSRQRQDRLMNIVIVGGGPTGVEVAGALGEMIKFTLAKDFRNIDPGRANIYLIEATDKVLPSFSRPMAARVVRDLESLGVQVMTGSPVTEVTKEHVKAGDRTIPTRTVIWAAGVKAVDLHTAPDVERDRRGRITVEKDLSLKKYPFVFVTGDLAHCTDADGKAVPGVAPAALQQGDFAGKAVLCDLDGKPRGAFRYSDKGQMSVIGRRRAVVESGKIKMGGWPAWLVWALVHIWYLTGFENRVLVLVQWLWAYLFYRKGARLILNTMKNGARKKTSSQT